MQARHALFLSTLFLSATALADTPPAAPAAPQAAQAQAQEHHRPSPEQMVERMNQHAQLNLSDDQKQKLAAVFRSEHEQMKAIHEKTKASLNQILTPDQQVKLQASRDEMRERHAARLQHRADRLKAQASALDAKAGAIQSSVENKTATPAN